MVTIVKLYKRSENKSDARYEYFHIGVFAYSFPSHSPFHFSQSDCGIFQIGNNPRFNVPAPPVDGVETVATILTVENDLVFNCLVDNARIDITAVCRDTPTSEHQLLTRDGRGQDAIRGKISNVYTLPDGDFWTVKGGSRAIFTNERKLKKTIGVDKTVALQDAKAEEDQLKRELQHHSSEEARLEHEHTQYQRDWNRAKSAYRDNKKTMESLENTIETLRGELETTENVNIDTTELEQEISNYEQEREALAQEEEQLDADIEAMLPEIEETKAKINECAARNDRVLAEMGAAEQNLTQQLESKSQLIDQVEKKRKKLEKYRSAIEEAQTKVDQLQFEKDKALSDARKLTFRYQALQTQAKEGEQSDALRADPTPEELEEIEPYEPKNDASYYEAKVKSLSKKIDTEKEKRAIARDDPADAQEKYSRALADLKNDKEVLAEVCDKIEELEEDLAQRHARSKDMRKGLQNTTRIKFKELLSLNKYCGKLQFDHEGKTLDLLVSKDSSKKSRNKDVKALR